MRRSSIREILEGQELLTRPPDCTVREAAGVMAERRVGALLVVDEGRLVGIFTERDALSRVLAAGLDPDATTLAEVMSRDPDTIGPDAPVADAIRRMDEFRYRHLPVVENGRLVGIVSMRDLPIALRAAMQHELEFRHGFAERAM